MQIICDKCKSENIEENTVMDFKFHHCLKCGHQQKFVDIDAKIEVGVHNKKAVTQLNNKLFLKAATVMRANQGASHIGWQGLGDFIDWLEENYKLEEI